jgi:fluoroacetyl-CoA thioesterase
VIFAIVASILLVFKLEISMQVGDSAEAEMMAGPQDMAKALCLTPRDDFPDVWATSRMIGLMEIAAARLMKPLLESGQLSVGVGINIRHTAATPVNTKVMARATFNGREGKLYKFTIEAFDAAGKVGEGDHTRAIIATERLLSGAAARVK